MLGVLTHHWCKKSKLEQSRNLLNRNGLAQSKAPGFVRRQTLHSMSDLTKITTLVIWMNNEIYDSWRASPERSAAMTGAEDMWSKPPESERFNVTD